MRDTHRSHEIQTTSGMLPTTSAVHVLRMLTQGGLVKQHVTQGRASRRQMPVLKLSSAEVFLTLQRFARRNHGGCRINHGL